MPKKRKVSRSSSQNSSQSNPQTKGKKTNLKSTEQSHISWAADLPRLLTIAGVTLAAGLAAFWATQMNLFKFAGADLIVLSTGENYDVTCNFSGGNSGTANNAWDLFVNIDATYSGTTVYNHIPFANTAYAASPIPYVIEVYDQANPSVAVSTTTDGNISNNDLYNLGFGNYMIDARVIEMDGEALATPVDCSGSRSINVYENPVISINQSANTGDPGTNVTYTGTYVSGANTERWRWYTAEIDYDGDCSTATYGSTYDEVISSAGSVTQNYPVPTDPTKKLCVELYASNHASEGIWSDPVNSSGVTIDFKCSLTGNLNSMRNEWDFGVQDDTAWATGDPHSIIVEYYVMDVGDTVFDQVYDESWRDITNAELITDFPMVPASAGTRDLTIEAKIKYIDSSANQVKQAPYSLSSNISCEPAQQFTVFKQPDISISPQSATSLDGVYAQFTGNNDNGAAIARWDWYSIIVDASLDCPAQTSNDPRKNVTATQQYFPPSNASMKRCIYLYASTSGPDGGLWSSVPPDNPPAPDSVAELTLDVNYTCNGTVPPNANSCTGQTGTGNYNNVIVQACGDSVPAQPCEYTCWPQYSLNDATGACEPDVDLDVSVDLTPLPGVDQGPLDVATGQTQAFTAIIGADVTRVDWYHEDVPKTSNCPTSYANNKLSDHGESELYSSPTDNTLKRCIAVYVSSSDSSGGLWNGPEITAIQQPDTVSAPGAATISPNNAGVIGGSQQSLLANSSGATSFNWYFVSDLSNPSTPCTQSNINNNSPTVVTDGGAQRAYGPPSSVDLKNCVGVVGVNSAGTSTMAIATINRVTSGGAPTAPTWISPASAPNILASTPQEMWFLSATAGNGAVHFDWYTKLMANDGTPSYTDCPTTWDSSWTKRTDTSGSTSNENFDAPPDSSQIRCISVWASNDVGDGGDWSAVTRAMIYLESAAACTGTIPNYAYTTDCNNSPSVDTPYSTVSTCGATACAWACDTGYVPIDTNSDGVNDNCRQIVCGDGFKDGAEECDDGNSINTDACTNSCSIAVCGDGITQQGVETCDDGNTANYDTCSSTCQTCDTSCSAATPTCSSGETTGVDACLNACTKPALTVPVISDFTAAPASIVSGDSSTLTWTTAGANNLVIDNGVGNVSTLSSKTVFPNSTTTYKMTATSVDSCTATLNTTVNVCVPTTCDATPQCGSPSNGTDNCGQPCTIPALPEPVINSFDASPSAINSGGSSTLSWNVSTTSGTPTLSIQGVGDVSGTTSTSVSPANTTTYTLTASLGSCNATRDATVTVQTCSAGPVIDSFAANPASLNVGETTNITWETTNASDVTLQYGSQEVIDSGLAADNTSPGYDLTFSSPRTHLRLVAHAANPGCSDAVTMIPVTVTECVPQPGVCYGLAVCGQTAPGTDTCGDSCVIDALGEPWIDYFTATPTEIVDDGSESSNLIWSTGADEMSISSDVSGDIGVVTNADMPYSVTPSETTVYTMTATNTYGVQVSSTAFANVICSAQDTATVNVTSATCTNPALINDFNANPLTHSNGSDVTFTWDTHATSGVQLRYGDGTVIDNIAQDVGSYTATVYGQNNRNVILGAQPLDSACPEVVDSLVITYVPPCVPDGTCAGTAACGVDMLGVDSCGDACTIPALTQPVISDYTATPNTIPNDGSVSSLLEWTATDATTLSMTESSANGGGVFDVTGQSSRSVTPQINTTYELTAENSDATCSATDIVSVNVQDVSCNLPPSIDLFEAVPDTFVNGDDITFNWETTNVDSVDLVYGNGDVIQSNITVPDGSHTATVYGLNNRNVDIVAHAIDTNCNSITDRIVVTHISNPTCGDNIVDLGETCDDGAQIDGDGCSATCDLEAVTGLSCENITQTTIDANWVENPVAASYDYRIAAAGNTINSGNEVAPASSHSFTGLTADTQYDIDVTSVNANGDSGLTSTVTCDTLPIPVPSITLTANPTEIYIQTSDLTSVLTAQLVDFPFYSGRNDYAGYTVEFNIVDNDGVQGALSAPSAVTNAAGVATVIVTAPNNAGSDVFVASEYSVSPTVDSNQATVDYIDGAFVDFTMNLYIPLESRLNYQGGSHGTHATDSLMVIIRSPDLNQNPTVIRDLVTSDIGGVQIVLPGEALTDGSIVEIAMKTDQHEQRVVSDTIAGNFATINLADPTTYTDLDTSSRAGMRFLPAGDVDGGTDSPERDNAVDSVDQAAWLYDFSANYGTDICSSSADPGVGTPLATDLDGNCYVGAEDLSLIIRNINTSGDDMP